MGNLYGGEYPQLSVELSCRITWQELPKQLTSKDHSGLYKYGMTVLSKEKFVQIHQDEYRSSLF